jgi:hypothetical protein
MLFHPSEGGRADGVLVLRQRNYLNIKTPSISALCHKVDTLKLYKIKFAKNNLFEMASVLSSFYPSAHHTFYSSPDPSFLSPSPPPQPSPSSAAAKAAAAPHFLEAHATIEEIAETLWVEDDDTESMLPGAHVTANAIRHLVIKDYFYVNRKPSGYVAKWMGTARHAKQSNPNLPAARQKQAQAPWIGAPSKPRRQPLGGHFTQCTNEIRNLV